MTLNNYYYKMASA